MHRLSWINPYEAQLVTHNLGDISYNPSYSDRKPEKASDFLTKFTDALLPEHAVSRNDILIASADYESDVRRPCTSISRFTEWCFAHLGIRACAESFGAALVASQSKNVESKKKFRTNSHKFLLLC